MALIKYSEVKQFQCPITKIGYFLYLIWIWKFKIENDKLTISYNCFNPLTYILFLYIVIYLAIKNLFVNFFPEFISDVKFNISKSKFSKMRDWS
jgi:hypothetical protein